MVDQLNAFASEVTRVAREVGTEGKLGGQAAGAGRRRHVEGPHRQRQLDGRQPDRPGPQHRRGHDRRRQRRPVARRSRSTCRARSSSSRTPSTRWSTSSTRFASEVTRVAREVGTEGKLGGQAEVPGVAGTWKDLTDNVNSMASTSPARCATSPTSTTAVANGDLSQKITVDVKGEILELKNTINTMVDQLNAFAVGSDARRARGRHRRQARRPGRRCPASPAPGRTSPTTSTRWPEPDRPGAQHRRRRRPPSPTATCRKKITVDVKGEILELKNTINTMVDQLNAFAVRGDARRARGRHRRQARRPGRGAGRRRHVEGPDRQRQLRWRQPDRPGAQHRRRRRPPSPTATCRKKITVDVQGEILELKNTINTMVDQLQRVRRPR